MTQPCHFALLFQSHQFLSLDSQRLRALSDSQVREELREPCAADETGVSVGFLPGMMLHHPTGLIHKGSLLAGSVNERMSAERMSFRIGKGRAAHFEIISRPSEKCMQWGSFMNSINCINVVYSGVESPLRCCC